MKRTRIAINGFGRMGRLSLRAAWGWPDFDWSLINEVKGGAACSAHLLNFDSVQGRWPHEARADDGAAIAIGDTRIPFTEHAKPGDVPWADHGVDIVLECSGRFRKPEDLQVYFERGIITTIHDITNTQTLVDRPDKDLRRARAAGLSLIPTTTGSATAIGLIYPELRGKLDGHAVRVPLLGGSLTDCAFQVKRRTTAEEANALLKSASDSGPLHGILGYEARPLVSIDFRGDPRSAIVDAPSTLVVDDTLVKIYAWYDNEWGYVNRMMELARKVATML
jgi:glyceraldehyde 3-phosphate dehydrogenase